jgi:hypothetical protein
MLRILALLAAAGLSACASMDNGAAPEQASILPSATSSDAAGPRGTGLTPAQWEVSQIAARDGDANYIMLDKARGEILMFRNGRPLFKASALTGESLADRLPPGALNTSFTHHPRLQDKVTPAGRYTVSEEPDAHYGPVLSVNEVQGKDWDIAVHKIFLGFPQEHRAERLASSDGREKHITWGCIDVSGATIHRLVANLPNRDATPFYILPTNQTHLAAFFPPLSARARLARATE